MHSRNFWIGLGLTFGIAGIAYFVAQVPYIEIVGHLVIAILIGILWRGIIGINRNYLPGVEYASTRLLRLGIILLGLRLNLLDIYEAGLPVFFYAIVLLIATLAVVYGLCRAFRVNQTLSILTACGTAICGAAAILAIAPIVKAKEQTIGVAVAVIALLGTAFTLLYTLLYTWLPFSDNLFGIFAGGTLHEVAHVVAASSVGGADAEDMGIVVKLTRVALLVPVAFGVMTWLNRGAKQTGSKSIPPIPWFLFGFVAMSVVNTLGILPSSIIDSCIFLSYLLLAMAMAGLGLKMDVTILRKQGGKVLLAGFMGTMILVLAGFALLTWLPF
ncbi:putative sulfate exporter family transporter [Alkalihalobacillus sp. FSL W8-0930]